MNVSEIIARLGGTAKTAELCEVSDSAVSQWIKGGIPKSRLMFLRLARPDVFGIDSSANKRRRSTDKKT